METRELPTEAELAEVLRDDPDEFMRFLWEYYRGKIVTCANKASRDLLSVEEVADVCQDALLAVSEKVRAPDFVPDRPLRMVFVIVRNKAVDYRRKKLGSPSISCTDLGTVVLDDLTGTSLSVCWDIITEEEKRRFNEELPEIVAGLSNQQSAAWESFVECLEDIRANNKYTRMKDVMSRLTGKSETVASAKSALNAAIKKIRSELKRRKFEFGEGGLV